MESQVRQLEMEFAMIKTTMQTAITMVNLQIVQIQAILQKGCDVEKIGRHHWFAQPFKGP